MERDCSPAPYRVPSTGPWPQYLLNRSTERRQKRQSTFREGAALQVLVVRLRRVLPPQARHPALLLRALLLRAQRHRARRPVHPLRVLHRPRHPALPRRVRAVALGGIGDRTDRMLLGTFVSVD